jgi:hypothetical protein
MPRQRISVQVGATHLDRLSDVEADLRKAGMTVIDQIAEIGHFIGVADEGAAERLGAIPGVVSVRSLGSEDDPEPSDYSIS